MLSIPLSPLLQLSILVMGLIVIRPYLGKYIFEIVQGQRSVLFLDNLEKFLFISQNGDDKNHEQPFRDYVLSFIFFHIILFTLLLLLQVFLTRTPLSLPLMVNNAVSLLTNTNWQAAAPETMYSNTLQMTGVALAQFLSPAVGIVVFLALTRAFARKRKEPSSISLGHFYLDMLRVLIGVLLPLSAICALIFIALGIPQHFQGDLALMGMDGKESLVTGGAMASQTAIKLLGTNGGGFLMANAAHPFENPGEWCNLLQMFMMLLLATALTDTFGRIVGDPKQGKAFFYLMLSMLIGVVFISFACEAKMPPTLNGIESRLGWPSSLLFNIVSLTSGTGATASALEGFCPLTTIFLMLSMMLSIIMGPAGTGLLQLILYALFAVFLAGLMIGRTPEFLNKKIDSFDIKCLGLGLFIPPTAVLICLLISLFFIEHSGLNNALTQLTYTFISTVHNNGSSYGRLDVGSPALLWLTSIAMLIGRMSVLFAGLYLAYSLATKQKIPRTRGTFPTNTPLFITFVGAAALVSLLLVVMPTFVIGPVITYVKHF